jgi:hypothetical protein
MAMKVAPQVNAVLERVSPNPDGTVTLLLRCGKHSFDLILEAPPPRIEAAAGVKVAVSQRWLLVAGRRWARRTGYTRCRLVPAG